MSASEKVTIVKNTEGEDVIITGTRLNLGCGPRKIPGYINVDLRPDADVVADARDLSYFEDEIADEIIASHLIEHFYYWEVQDILAEWKRVLKPGAVLYIECPNILKCAALLLHGDYQDNWTMWGLFGDPRHKNPLMCHKWGYHPASLAHELHQAGFVDIGQARVQKQDHRDMRLVATKPEAA